MKRPETDLTEALAKAGERWLKRPHNENAIDGLYEAIRLWLAARNAADTAIRELLERSGK